MKPQLALSSFLNIPVNFTSTYFLRCFLYYLRDKKKNHHSICTNFHFNASYFTPIIFSLICLLPPDCKLLKKLIILPIFLFSTHHLLSTQEDAQ